jgi:hypothetical protein
MWWIFAAIGAILAQIVMFLRVWAVALYYFDLEERLGSESPMRSVEL